jgi:hypothetical protein
LKLFKFNTASLVVAFVLSTFAVTTAMAQPDLVSSDSNDIPLIDDRDIPLGYHAQDVSADGRYVLLSNYSTNFGLDANTGGIIFPNNCEILRKDRQTHKLITVFESDPEGFKFCNGARISADGSKVAASPAGSEVSCSEGGEITALIVRDLDAGTDTEITTIWTPGSGDIARLCPGETFRYPGKGIHSLTGSADFAVLVDQAVIGGLIQGVFLIVDVQTGTVEPVELQAGEDVSPWIRGLALSEDGSTIAVNANLYNPGIVSPGPILCGQTGRCEPAGTSLPQDVCDSWWECPIPAEPQTTDIYIIDRISGTHYVPDALAELPLGIALQANAWSADGQQLSFLELPEFPRGCFYPGDGEPAECFPIDACEGADCELTVHHYDVVATSLTSYLTDYDPDTLSMCRPTAGSDTAAVTNLNCAPKLSRDGNRLLLARAVAHPFGGDWLPNPGSGDFVCVTQESLQNPAAELEFIECPLDGGFGLPSPFPGPTQPGEFPTPDGGLGNYFPVNTSVAGPTSDPIAWGGSFYFSWVYQTSYNAPVNWYVKDFANNHTTLVSVTGDGELFQSTGTLFSDNGTTVIYRSQDPRLQTEDPEALSETEATLDEACFWSPAGSSSNLRVATNDNVRFATEEEFNIYRETPVFCPVPDPELAAHIFAGDIADGVNLFVQNRRDRRNGRGAMKTLLGNFSSNDATMIAVSIEVSGLGEGGAVFVAPESNCEAYEPVSPASSDDSILIRCELDALGSREFQPIRWRMSSSDPATAIIRSHVESNEPELRPRNNVDIDRVRLQRTRNNRRARSR